MLGWLSSILFGERALITEFHVAVTLGASIGILSGVVLFPEKALLQAAELREQKMGSRQKNWREAPGKERDMAIKAITTDSFRDDVLKTRKPVLVKFWAPWCGYCRALAPALESIEKQYENLLSVGRINFDTETAVARRYNIHKLPTLLLFINGTVAGFLIDPSSEKEIDAFLKKMLRLNVGGLYGKHV